MNRLLLIFLAALARGVSSTLNVEGKELIFVQMVFRNGFSAPNELYPNDPNNPNLWEEGLGELTLLGRKQIYQLGKNLRQRYSHFITANPREVTMQCSTRSKNLHSGLCMLASLYAPTKEWQFVPGLPWQPVPVFYIPAEKDKVLGPLHGCPLVVEQMEKLVDLFGTDTVLDMYKQQMKFWSLHSGIRVKDWNDVVTLYRILSTERSYNHTLPGWVRKYWTELECLNDYAYKINFNDPKILKVIGGPILRNFVKSAVDKVNGELDDQTRVMAYSGQSSHVAGLLGALKNFNNKEPPFASAVLMELFKNERDGDHSARWLFMNGTEPQVLQFPECREFCPLDHMFNKTKHWEKPKWGRDCRGSPTLEELRELLAGIGI